MSSQNPEKLPPLLRRPGLLFKNEAQSGNFEHLATRQWVLLLERQMEMNLKPMIKEETLKSSGEPRLKFIGIMVFLINLLYRVCKLYNEFFLIDINT